MRPCKSTTEIPTQTKTRYYTSTSTPNKRHKHTDKHRDIKTHVYALTHSQTCTQKYVHTLRHNVTHNHTHSPNTPNLTHTLEDQQPLQSNIAKINGAEISKTRCPCPSRCPASIDEWPTRGYQLDLSRVVINYCGNPLGCAQAASLSLSAYRTLTVPLKPSNMRTAQETWPSWHANSAPSANIP